MGRTNGIDWTLPDAPPLRLPPLSLLQLAPPLLQVDDAVAAQQDALEGLASAQVAVATAEKAHADAPPEEREAAAAAAESARSALADQAVWVSEQAKRLEAEQQWEDGFEYLPELSLGASMEIFVPGTGTPSTDGALKRTDSTQGLFIPYDPFDVVAHDDRSMFGWPASDLDERAQRALRAELAHEGWEVEREFWTGEKIPTNYHLTASPLTPTTSPHRTVPAFVDPTAAPTTVLGTAVGLKQSLAALDQAIANADAGLGMIHATPYLVQLWMSTFPFIRDSSGRVYTVNMNLIVPGYGYPGTGPDSGRTVADGVTNGTTTVTSATAAFTSRDVGKSIATADLPAGTRIVTVSNATTVIVSAAATGSHSGQTLVLGATGDATDGTKQWAYATDTVYRLTGAVRRLPWDLNQAAPELVVNDSAEVRAERSHALLTNRLCRAAVLVDTTVA